MPVEMVAQLADASLCGAAFPWLPNRRPSAPLRSVSRGKQSPSVQRSLSCSKPSPCARTKCRPRIPLQDRGRAVGDPGQRYRIGDGHRRPDDRSRGGQRRPREGWLDLETEDLPASEQVGRASPPVTVDSHDFWTHRRTNRSLRTEPRRRRAGNGCVLYDRTSCPFRNGAPVSDRVCAEEVPEFGELRQQRAFPARLLLRCFGPWWLVHS